jgi:hypothetical protein
MKAKWYAIALTLVCTLIVLGPLQFGKSQTSSGTVVAVVPAQNSVRVGETLTVNITITNVQNLYGVDVTLDWNSSLLQIQSATSQVGVETYPGGVLHETSGYPIIVVQDNSSEELGEYHLVAASQGSADAFNGNGLIATIKFNVTNLGHSELTLQSDLADHPQPGETNAETIMHSDVSATVDATPIPEFPAVIILGLLVAVATTSLLLSKRLLRKNMQQS